MMKNLFVIQTHSFVDMITNSSSELFVCDNQKTIEAVKEILQTLLDTHNKLTSSTYKFEDVFGTIEVAKYGFDYYSIPEAIRDNYDKYQDYRDHFDHSRFNFNVYSSNDENSEKQELREKEHQIGVKNDVWQKEGDKITEEERASRWEKNAKETGILWTDYGARHLNAQLILFIEFLKQNEFIEKDIILTKKACIKYVKQHIKNKQGQYPFIRNVDFGNKKMNDAYETFSHWESWGITSKKGSIFINSKEDNSIPYDMMDAISSYLNASRYHLG